MTKQLHPEQATRDLGLFIDDVIHDKRIQARIRKGINALRSGKYPQGKGWLLTRTGTRCCLGVFNTVCRLRELNRYALSGTYRTIGLKDGMGSFGRVGGGRGARSLTADNDSGKYSFLDIAKFLEDQLEVKLRKEVVRKVEK